MNDLPLDKLGPFVVLQWAAAVIVLCGLALAVYRGTRDRKAAERTLPPDARYFFDGPLAIALNLLRDIRGALFEIVKHVEPLGEEERNQTRLLSEIKAKLDELKDIKRRR